MYCPYCHKKLPEGARFCDDCGNIYVSKAEQVEWEAADKKKKKILPVMVILCVLALCFTLGTAIWKRQQERLAWHFTGKTATLTVSGIGNMTDLFDDGKVPWAAQKKQIQTAVLQEGVTDIGQKAFFGCKELTAVAIAESVTKIGDNAFAYCEKLPAVSIPGSVTSIGSYAFYQCGSLAAVTVPDGVTDIGDGAFACCAKLTSVTIPHSVKRIGTSAFAWCPRTMQIIYTGTKAEWAEFADCFAGTVICANGIYGAD